MKFLIPAAAVILFTSPALASVQISIYEVGPDVIAEAIGSLVLPPSTNTSHCGGAPNVIPYGAIAPSLGAICVGSGQGYTYSIAGPSSFGFETSIGRYADESKGGLFGINGALGLLASDGTEINSQSIWRGTTLSGLGLEPGPIGKWQIGDDSITATAVPGPLAALAAPLGWAWSRRLRNRIQATGGKK